MPKTTRYLALCTLCTVALAAPLHAQTKGVEIKCWTNSHGVRECGNTVPPEYSQGAAETLDDRGLTLDVQPAAKSRDELAREAERRRQEKAKAEAEKLRKKRQAEYDRTLLATYSNEGEIKAARDRNLSAVDANIHVTEVTLKRLERRHGQLQKQAANLERAGKSMPKTLKSDIASVQASIANKKDYIQSQQKEKARLNRLYAGYLTRFRQLRGQDAAP